MTTERDPIDDMSRALFEASRRERPSDGVKRRAMEQAAVAAGRSRSRVLWFSIAAAAVVAGLVLVAFATLRGSPPTIAIYEERSPRREVPSPVTSSQPAPPSDVPPDMSAVAIRRPSSAPKHDAGAPRTLSLNEEIKALDDARAAVEAGNAAQALRLLGAYERTTGQRRLTSEATLLRIRALAATGKHGEAAALARRFIQANPADPLVDRARAFADTDSGHTQ